MYIAMAQCAKLTTPELRNSRIRPFPRSANAEPATRPSSRNTMVDTELLRLGTWPGPARLGGPGPTCRHGLTNADPSYQALDSVGVPLLTTSIRCAALHTAGAPGTRC